MKLSDNQEFVITSADAAKPDITDILRDYPALDILDSLDAATVLVQMTETERQTLARNHPELAIEPNILYQLL